MRLQQWCTKPQWARLDIKDGSLLHRDHAFSNTPTMLAGFRQLRKLHQTLRQRQGKGPMCEQVCECVMKTSLTRLHISSSVPIPHLQWDYTASLRCIMRRISRTRGLQSEHSVLACMTCEQGHMPYTASVCISPGRSVACSVTHHLLGQHICTV